MADKLIKVSERQTDSNGKVIVKEVKGPDGKPMKTSEVKDYFIEMPRDLEKLLGATGLYGFQSISEEQRNGLTEAQIKEGQAKLEELSKKYIAK